MPGHQVQYLYQTWTASPLQQLQYSVPNATLPPRFTCGIQLSQFQDAVAQNGEEKFALCRCCSTESKMLYEWIEYLWLSSVVGWGRHWGAAVNGRPVSASSPRGALIVSGSMEMSGGKVCAAQFCVWDWRQNGNYRTSGFQTTCS